MIGVRNEPGWFVTMFSLVSQNVRQGRHSVLESSNVGLNVHLSTREMKSFLPLYHPPHSLCSSRPLTLPYILRQNSSEGCPILTSGCRNLRSPLLLVFLGKGCHLTRDHNCCRLSQSVRKGDAVGGEEHYWPLVTRTDQTLRGRPNEHGRVS